MKKILLFVLVLCIASSEALFSAQTDQVALLITKGDSLAAAWNHEMAAITYMNALKLDPNNYEAAWKAGDETTEFANKLSDNQKTRKESLFEKAVELCKKATEIKPDGWEGHFKLSVAYGRLALFRGGKKKIELSKLIKIEADKAVELNPNADLAYHVLGRWHQGLANLSWVLKSFAKILYGGVPPGTNEEAVKMFKKAIEINPNHIEHYLELARTYQYMGKKELMKAPLKKVLELPNVEEDDPEFKKEAKAMLKKLK